MLSTRPNEIIIKAKGGSVKDMDIIITNIEPNEDIVAENDPSYVEKRVSKILLVLLNTGITYIVGGTLHIEWHFNSHFKITLVL